MSTDLQQLNTRDALLRAIRGVRQDIDRLVAEADENLILRSGSFGEWSLKDLLAHLTGWRQVAAARLEAALHHQEPVFPWPPQLEAGNGPDARNQWFFETSRDKPLADVVQESHEAFDRVESAISALSEDDLFLPDRFSWLKGAALCSVVVKGAIEHYRLAHEPDIRGWLEQL